MHEMFSFVELTETGVNKIAIVKAIRTQMSDLSLKDFKHITDAAPKV